MIKHNAHFYLKYQSFDKTHKKIILYNKINIKKFKQVHFEISNHFLKLQLQLKLTIDNFYQLSIILIYNQRINQLIIIYFCYFFHKSHISICIHPLHFFNCIHSLCQVHLYNMINIIYYLCFLFYHFLGAIIHYKN